MKRNVWAHTAVIQVKQSNSKCRVWPLLPYSNLVGLDKKLSNNPEKVSINLGTWPMSNEALIAYYLISKQHFNHAKSKVQFDLTIRIVNTREGVFGLQISGGVWSWTSKIIEIKISSLQVFSYQQLLHARFFSNVSMWVYPAVHAQTWKTTTVCSKTGPWREFILSLVFFTVCVLSRFPFKLGNPVNKQTNFPVKSNRCFLSGSQLYQGSIDLFTNIYVHFKHSFQTAGGGGGHSHIWPKYGYVPLWRPPFWEPIFCSLDFHFLENGSKYLLHRSPILDIMLACGHAPLTGPAAWSFAGSSDLSPINLLLRTHIVHCTHMPRYSIVL